MHVGLIFSGDSFYPARPELMTRMVEHGVLAIEMEASALYTIAAGHGRRALAICTVSDHVVTGEETTAEERERTFGDMVEIALQPASARAAGSSPIHLEPIAFWQRTPTAADDHRAICPTRVCRGLTRTSGRRSPSWRSSTRW